MARKILLADDSVTAQNMGRKILADAGYEVVAVNNGSAALKKISEIKPDLVVLDVYMPGYSGLEVCQRLKESHETARIPVLLTVGKLEPFKPEEAQRVRAEGFIVKPFEASELLSALSKLEDKVVPRAESSRPGRFARAIAAFEETARGRGEDNGWKNRISFPHEKSQEEQASENPDEQVSSYNPVNRDLRTVVETPEERAQEKGQEQETGKQESPGREAEKVDVAALAVPGTAASGLPKDVTQEEVGAVAAAAAQIQAATAAAEEGQRSSEAATQAAPETVGFEPPIREIDLDAAAPPIVQAPANEERTGDTTSRDSDSGEADSHEDSQDEPVTMAATADSLVNPGGGSRWTAVAVALEGDEAGLSLDHEMEKASATAEGNKSESESISVPAGIVSIAAEAPVEASAPEAAYAPVAISEVPPVVSAMSEQPASFSNAAAETPMTSAMTSLAPTEQAAGTAELPNAFVQHSETAEAQVEPKSSESEQERRSAVVSDTLESSTYHAFSSTDTKAEAQLAQDHELVKSTAAAWANWRQIQDTGKGSQSEADGPQAVDEIHAAKEINAAAAAAGAEQSLPSVNPQEHENTSDVASIVDSVLADLRPKLMKEISRKIAEKK